MLKVKASIGSQGNDNISNYLYVDYYSIEPSGEDMSICLLYTSDAADEL